MEVSARNLHRDIGYFYVGLLIAFSISGIFLNHRQVWHPSKYRAEVTDVTIEMPEDPETIDEKMVASMGRKLGITEAIRRFRVNNGELLVSFEKHDLTVDVLSGSGDLVKYIKVPVLAQMTQLHQDTNKWWIYYSDFFGLAMLTMAITGMFMIPEGALSFRKRGWKLALTGIIFPLIFLFLLS